MFLESLADSIAKYSHLKAPSRIPSTRAPIDCRSLELADIPPDDKTSDLGRPRFGAMAAEEDGALDLCERLKIDWQLVQGKMRELW